MKKRVLALLILPWALWAQNDVVYWVPDSPTQGENVTIYYNVINGTLPDNATQVILHMGVNGWQNIQDYNMSPEGNGWWSYTYFIPQGVNILDFVFTDGQGNWDNNGGMGIDYHIPIGQPGLFTPSNPGPNDTITIHIAHSIPGNLWWGVNGWHTPLDDYWPPNTVDGSPGFSVETPLQGPDSSGFYFISIGPFNRGRQMVRQVDFVFHWSDGTWDNNDYRDYHIILDYTPRPEDPTVEFVNIADDQILSDPQPVTVRTTNSSYNELFLDGQTRMITIDSVYTIDLVTTDLSYGPHELVAFARRDNGRVMMDRRVVWKVPEITYADFPPYDELGVHDRLDGTVTFSILAPGKHFISLVGDFNNWDPEATFLNYDSTQGIWWVNIPLDAGVYEYMYNIEGVKRIGDPWATDVDWQDTYGNEDWRPENQRSVVRIGQEDFPWTDQDFQRPAMSDLIIYEVLLRDFSPEGDLQGLINRLDYLADLGINAIELMPNYEFPGASSWGYNPAFYLAPESSYGTPDDFKTLVNEAHARGIAVLMDLVFNHADAMSPYFQLYGDDYEHSPYFHAEGNEWGFPDFDHGRDGTRRLTAKVVRYWAQEYHIDGYRYDNTDGIGWSGLNDYGVSWFSYNAWQQDHDLYQIAEHFGSDVRNLIQFTKIRSHWHNIFHDQLKANLRRGSFEGAWWGDMDATERALNFAADGFSSSEACVNYLESHDEQRVIWEVQTNGLNYDQALQAAALGAEVLFTSTGIPMFYMGAEFGMDTERRIEENPLRWYYLDRPENATLYQLYRRLIEFRKQYAALRSENFQTAYKNNSQKLIVYFRTLEGAPGVVVAANFDAVDHTLNIPLPWSGTWYEFLTEDTLTSTGSELVNYTVPAASARIFASEHLWVGTAPEPRPRAFQLSPPYPNPFNNRVVLNFTLPRREQVRFQVFDLQGRMVYQSHSAEPFPAGVHRWVWEGVDQAGRAVSSGAYFIRLLTPSNQALRKVVLLK